MWDLFGHNKNKEKKKAAEDQYLVSACIDFGNQNCLVGIPCLDNVEIIRNQASQRQTPSQVTYTPACRYAGIFSKQQEFEYQTSTFTHLKRLIGLLYQGKEREYLESIISFTLVNLADGKTGILNSVTNQTLQPIQCIAFLFKELVNHAIDNLPSFNTTKSVIIDQLIVIVPPWWNQIHRRMLLDACIIAGYPKSLLLNSTTAAAISYSQIHPEILLQIEKNHPILVLFIDFGSTSFSCSLVQLRGQGQPITVLSSASDRHLGGDLFTDELFKILVEKVAESGPAIELTQKTQRRLRNEAESIKKKLSVNQIIQTEFEGVIIKVTRAEFESRIQFLLEQILIPLNQVFFQRKYKKEDIFAIEAQGGSSRIPSVRQIIADFFGKEPTHLLDLDECFVQGGAYFGSFLDHFRNQNDKEKFNIFYDVNPEDVFLRYQDRGEMKQMLLYETNRGIPRIFEFTIPVIGNAVFPGFIQTAQDLMIMFTYQNPGATENARVEANFVMNVNSSNFFEIMESYYFNSRGKKVNLKIEIKQSIGIELFPLIENEKKASSFDALHQKALGAQNSLEEGLLKIENYEKQYFTEKQLEVVLSVRKWIDSQTSNKKRKFEWEFIENKNTISTIGEEVSERIQSWATVTDGITPIRASLDQLHSDIVKLLEDPTLDKERLEDLEMKVSSMMSEITDILILPRNMMPPECPFSSMESKVEDFKKVADAIRSKSQP